MSGRATGGVWASIRDNTTTAVLITIVLALLSAGVVLLAVTLNSLGDRITETNDRITSLEARIDDRITSLEARIDDRITSLEARIDDRITSLEARIDARFAAQDAKFAAQDAKIDALGEKIDQIGLSLAVLIARLEDRDDPDAALAVAQGGGAGPDGRGPARPADEIASAAAHDGTPAS